MPSLYDAQRQRELLPSRMAADEVPPPDVAPNLSTHLVRGLKGALVTHGADSALRRAMQARAQGDELAAQREEQAAQSMYQQSQRDAPRVSSLRDASGPGDVVDWLGYQAGAMPVTLPQGVVGGVAGAAAGAPLGPLGAAAGAGLGAAGAMYPALRDASLGRRYNSPTAAPIVTPEDAQAAMTASEQDGAMQSAIMGGAALLAGPGTLARGLAAPVQAARVARVAAPRLGALGTATKNTAIWGGAGVAGEAVAQQQQNLVDPNRDRSHDTWGLVDAGVANAALSAPFEVPTAMATRGAGAAVRAGSDVAQAAGEGAKDMGGKARDVLGDAKERGGRLIDLLETKWDERPRGADGWAEAVGTGVAQAANRAEEALVRRLARGRDADVDTLLAPQRQMTEQQLRDDDAVKHQAAAAYADRVLNNMGEHSPEVQRAAADYLASNRRADAWRPLADAAFEAKRVKDVTGTVEKFLQELKTKVGAAADEASGLVDEARGAYDENRNTRANLQELGPEQRADLIENLDLFDEALWGELSQYARLPAAVEAEHAPAITYATRAWVENGFKLSQDGEIYVPPRLLDMFAEPEQAVRATTELLRREGRVDERVVAKLDEVEAEIRLMRAQRDALEQAVEQNILPSVEVKFGFDRAEIKQIARELADALANGENVNAKLLSYFGPGARRVLDKLRDVLRREPRREDEVLLGPEDTADGFGEVEPTTRYHHYREGRGNEDAVPFERGRGDLVGSDGVIYANMTERAAARRAEMERNGAQVQEVGYFDYLRERYRDDPEGGQAAMLRFLTKYGESVRDEVNKGVDAERALNDKFFVFRESALPTDKAVIRGSEFNKVTGKGAQNLWGETTGNGKDTVADGRIWLRRESPGGKGSPTEFATSSQRIIRRMAGLRDGAEASELFGVANQPRLLMQGLAAILDARHDDGSFALTGEVGFKRTAHGPIEWANPRDAASGVLDPKTIEALVKELPLYTKDGSRVKDALAETQRAKDAELIERAQALFDAERQGVLDYLDRKGLAVSEAALDAYISGDGARMAKYRREIAALRNSNRADQAEQLRVLDNALRTKGQADSMARLADIMHRREMRQQSEQDVVGGSRDAMADPTKHKGARSTFEDTGGRTRTVDDMGNPLPINDDVALKADAAQRKAARELGKPDQVKLMADPHVARAVELLRKGVPHVLKYATTLGDAGYTALRAAMKRVASDHASEALSTRAQRVVDGLVRKPDALKARVDDPKANAQLYKAKAAANRATPEEVAKFEADVHRRLGPDIEVAAVEELFGKVNGRKASMSGQWTKGVIKASLYARDLGQIGAHESMHEFVARLRELPEASKVLKLLDDAANLPHVKRSLERMLSEHPSALKQLADADERVAYMFQFHQAGLLKLTPASEGAFKKVMNLLRRITGLLSDEQKADMILRAFDDGKTQTADAAAQYLANNVEARARMYKALGKTMEPATKVARRMILTAEANLERTNNPHLKELRRVFKRSVGEDGAQGLFDAKDHQTKIWTNKLAAVFEGAERADLDLAAEHLVLGTSPKDPVAARIVNQLRGEGGLFSQMHDYMKSANVRRLVMVEGADGKLKPRWEPIPKRKNYFPRAYDTEKLVANRGEFIDLMLKHHGDVLEKIGKEADDPGEHLSAQQVAEALHNRLINGFGQPDLAESTSRLGFSPFMQSVNARSLDWLAPEILSKFAEKDLAKIATSYIVQAVKRTEYTRRFSYDGSVLQGAVSKAFDHEMKSRFDGKYGDGTWDKMLKARTNDTTHQYDVLLKQGAGVDDSAGALKLSTDALKYMETVKKDVMSLEGTLGYTINPRLRRFENSMMVYQNMRVLATSLFSQFVDPLGLVVRGAPMQEAWSAYKRGLREVWASVKDDPIKDLDASIAAQVGTTDATSFLASLGQLYSSQFIGGKFRRVNEALFKYNGMEGFNRGMQISATRSAINFIKRHAEQPTKHSEAYLKELNLDPKKVEIKDGELNYDDPVIRRAIHQWVNGAILRPNAAQRPAWASDPHYMVFWHMKQFAYTFHDVIIKRAVHDVKKYDESGPALALLAAYTPVMVASDTMKSLLLTGDEPAWMNMGLDAQIEHGAMRAGLAGQYQPLADVAISGHPTMSLAGPTMEHFTSLLGGDFGSNVQNSLPGASVLNKVNP